MKFISLFLFILYPIIASDNDKYVENEISNINKLLESGTFVNGLIYFQNDTLETELLYFKRKAKINFYLFCVSRNGNDSIKVYRASEINGYKIQDEIYIKHISDGEHFFIKNIKSGKINLFERKGLPSDNRFLYFLKFPNTNNYYVINPDANNTTVTESPESRQSGSTSRGTVTYYTSKGIDLKFKAFITRYLGDCERVVNMVNTDFYTINDIPIIVESYNNCFDFKNNDK